MTQKLNQLRQALESRLGQALMSIQHSLGELTVQVSAQDYAKVVGF